MGACMFMLRLIAAADVATGQAHSQVNPDAPDLQAILTAFYRFPVGPDFDLIDMRTGFHIVNHASAPVRQFAREGVARLC